MDESTYHVTFRSGAAAAEAFASRNHVLGLHNVTTSVLPPAAMPSPASSVEWYLVVPNKPNAPPAPPNGPHTFAKIAGWYQQFLQGKRQGGIPAHVGFTIFRCLGGVGALGGP